MPFPVDNIRAACEANGISLAKLERELSIGNGVIAKWEKAKTYPPIDRLVAISERLGVPLSYLVYGENENQSSGVYAGGLHRTKYDFLNSENKKFIDDLIDKLLKSQSAE